MPKTVERTKWQTLSKKQKLAIEEWRKTGFCIGNDVTPIDEGEAEASIVKLLKFYNLYTNQKFLFFPSINAVNDFLVENKAKQYIDSHILGSGEIYWVAYYLCCEEIFGVKSRSKTKILIKYQKKQMQALKLWYNVTQVSGWFWPFSEYVLVSDHPREIHFETDAPENTAPRLHRVGGPSIRFADDFCIYSMRGVRLTKKVAMGEFDAKDIVKEKNQEVKRCMLDIYTAEKFIQETKAKLVNKDEFGELYTADVGETKPLCMVKVINKSPEPDGTFKVYWLGVDPSAYGGLKTARAAVASTWRHKDNSLVFPKPEDYNPALET